MGLDRVYWAGLEGRQEQKGERGFAGVEWRGLMQNRGGWWSRVAEVVVGDEGMRQGAGGRNGR